MCMHVYVKMVVVVSSERMGLVSKSTNSQCQTTTITITIYIHTSTKIAFFEILSSFFFVLLFSLSLPQFELKCAITTILYVNLKQLLTHSVFIARLNETI